MTLSVVIVNWNTRDFLLAALRSIYEQPVATSCEVIVVDNASGDGSADAVASAFPQTRLVRNASNDGYARGNNQGLQMASGSYCLLLNPDVELPRGGLDAVVRIMDEMPDVAALGVRLVGPDGRVQQSVRGFPTPFAIFCEATGLSRLAPRSRVLASYRMPWFTYDTLADVDQPMGTFLMIRHDALDRIGLLDERFPIFFNEVDWCFRAKAAGLRIVFSPAISVLHHGGAGTGQVSAAMAWESRRGLLTYYRKHYAGAAHAPVYWIACASSWVHAWLVSRRRARTQ